MKWVVVVLLMGTANAATAAFETSGKVQSGLAEFDSATFEYSFYRGYVIGVFDTWSSIKICTPPQEVTAAEVAEAARVGLANAPPERSADVDIVIALAAKWPCTGNNPRGSFFITGNALASKLREATGPLRWFGMGYVAGAVDSYGGILVCLPAGVTLGQVEDIVTKFLRANPEGRHRTAESHVSDALEVLWPCRSNAPTVPETRSPQSRAPKRPTPAKKPQADGVEPPF